MKEISFIQLQHHAFEMGYERMIFKNWDMATRFSSLCLRYRKRFTETLVMPRVDVFGLGQVLSFQSFQDFIF